MLSEVGAAGQRRVCATTAHVAGQDENGHLGVHEVACCYALRAGFAHVDAGTIDVDALAPRDVVVQPAARAVLAGARAALSQFRAALQAKAPPAQLSEPRPQETT